MEAPGTLTFADLLGAIKSIDDVCVTNDGVELLCLSGFGQLLQTFAVVLELGWNQTSCHLK
jgi:hypothetical protein